MGLKQSFKRVNYKQSRKATTKDILTQEEHRAEGKEFGDRNR